MRLVHNNGKTLLKNVEMLTVNNFASKISVFLLVLLYTSVLFVLHYDSVMRYISDVNYDKQRVASVGLRLRLVGMVLKTLYLIIWDN